MKFAKLIMVTENNNNKEYIMKQLNDSTFEVQYGRVGQAYHTVTYTMYEWDKKYREKVRKGYKDISDLVEKEVITDDNRGLPYDYITNVSIRDILNRLYQYTDRYLKANYLIKATDVSRKQIDDAYQILADLGTLADTTDDYDYCTVKSINKRLISLYEVIPRKMANVNDNLLDTSNTDESKLKDKIKQELDMLKTMADAVELREKEKARKSTSDNNGDSKVLSESEQQAKILEDLGLIVEEVSKGDVKFIKEQLGECSNLYKNAWKITNPATSKKFNDLIETEPYKGKKIAHYWHGSRNQNWHNIIQTGLVTNPKGVTITGKMFGYGIYFAPKAKKSLGYTSLDGSYWASGNDKSGFMALFDVALGNVLDVYDHYRWCSRTNKEEMWKHNKCHTLYAHEGRGFLYNDEVIAYDDAQVNIKYLVELSR